MKRTMRKKQKQGLALFKLRLVGALASDASGNITSVFQITNPIAALDFTPLQSLYDSYRVHGVSHKFMPALVNNASTTTAFTPLYTNIDYDDQLSISTVNAALEFENCKMKNLFSPYKLYYRIPKLVNLSTSSPMFLNGYMDINNPQATGSIKYTATGLTPSTTYGQLIQTFYVSCKNRI